MKIGSIEKIKYYPELVLWDEYVKNCPIGYRILNSIDIPNLLILSNNRKFITISYFNNNIDLKRIGYKIRDEIYDISGLYFHCAKIEGQIVRNGYCSLSIASKRFYNSALIQTKYKFFSIYIKK